MSIIRGPRPDSNFYILDKKVSEDKRLSWAARGLLIYLLGKPNHWQVSVQALVNETKESAKATGRDATWGLLRELVDAGYCTRNQVRKADGTLGEMDYLISEDSTKQPLTDLPCPAQPLTANPTQVSIEEKQGLKKKQGLRGESAGAQNGFAPPAGADALQAGFRESGMGSAPVQQQEQGPEAKTPARPSMATAVCIALKSIGMSSVNPGNEKLRILLDAGADISTFVELGRKCVKDGKPFTYLLATVAGKMQDAAALAQTAMAAPQQATGRHQPAPPRYAGATAAIFGNSNDQGRESDDGRTINV